MRDEGKVGLGGGFVHRAGFYTVASDPLVR